MLPRLRLLVLALLPLAACLHRGPDGRPQELRIYLARHGQTAWNAERRLQGQTDVELNATGREQARNLGERLALVHFDRVYSSSLKRSRETAEAARGSAPLESLPGLAERALGAFEGLRLDGSEPAREAEYRRRREVADDALDGGESEERHFDRVSSTIETILRRHPSGAILIVGHGGTNPLILRKLLELAPAEAAAIQQANDEIYLVEVVPGRRARLWKNIVAANLGEL